MRPEIDEVAAFALRERAIDLYVYDEEFLEKSLGRRMAECACTGYGEYLGRMQADPEEAAALLGSLHIGFSEFFRNPLTFACLEALVLPSILDAKKRAGEGELRIWSAACACGQEAYSIAILSDELLAQESVALRLFATDNDEAGLTSARQGVYESGSLGKLSVDRLQRYFSPREGRGGYSVLGPIKDAVEFSCFDLLTEEGCCPPMSVFGSFDLVFCSNLLFYYSQGSQLRILKKLEASLAPGGYLATGEAERDILARRGYHEEFPGSALFRR